MVKDIEMTEELRKRFPGSRPAPESLTDVEVPITSRSKRPDMVEDTELNGDDSNYSWWQRIMVKDIEMTEELRKRFPGWRSSPESTTDVEIPATTRRKRDPDESD